MTYTALAPRPSFIGLCRFLRLRRLRASSFALLAAPLFACQVAAPPPPDCRLDDDCAIHKVCEDGACIPPPPRPLGTAASLIRDDTGLVFAARAGATPLSDRGVIEIARSSDGAAWRTVSTFDAGTDARAPSIGRAGDGRLVLAYAGGATFPGGNWVTGASDHADLFVTDSTDDGVSFADPRRVDLTPFSSATPHGRIIRLDSGILLLAVDARYGAADASRPDAPTGDFAAVIRSPDNGQTWWPPLPIARNYREPVIAAIGQDHLVALLRADDGRLSISASHDHAETWSTPFSLIDAARQSADLVGLDDGRLLLTFVSSWPVGSVQALFSDNGESFGLPHRYDVVDGPADAALGAVSVEAHDGTLVTMTAAATPPDRRNRALHGTFSRYHQPDLPRSACSDIGSGKQLFLDDALVERRRGVSLRMHPPEKTREVLVHSDRDGEGFIAGNYPVVIGEGPRVRVWYEAYELDYAKKGDYGARLCYAESIGGKPFEKPDLGLIPYNGSLSNNIVFPNGDYLYHGGSVFLDPTAPAGERYKLVFMGDNGIRGAVSPDGLHFTRLAQTLLGISSDTQNVGFWDDQIKRYVVFLRGHEGDVRVISRAESTDFRVFSNPRVIMRPDALDPPNVDLYNSAATRYEWAPNAYFMFVSVYDHASDTLAVQLATSRDGIHFTRHRDPLWLPRGPMGAFDSMAIYQAPGIVRDSEELYVYYAGFDVSHNAVDPALARHLGTVSRALFRLDGFFAAETSTMETSDTGTLTTIPIKFTGKRLHVNAIGRVRASISDESGGPIDGFGLDDCVPFSGDAIDGMMTWRGGADVGALAGRPVKVTFELTGAQLYAYQFKDN